MEIVNFTPLAAERVCLMGRDGRETLVVAVKASLAPSAGELELLDEQLPVHATPVHYGPPAESSLRYDSDLVLDKPGTDVSLIGHAYPQSRGQRQVAVSVTVGPVNKTALVFGDRVWSARFGMATPTRGALTERVALRYENAFGGADERGTGEGAEFLPQNPVGKGFRAKRSKLPIDGSPLPNIEDPKHLMTSPSARPEPAGFGLIAPHWAPRVDYAGTYDEAWLESTCPLLPEDFDSRFFLAAAAGMSVPDFLRGEEEVLVENASPQGRLQFQLPGILPRVAARIGTRLEELEVRLESLVIEPDEPRVIMVWTGRTDVHGRLQDVSWIRIKSGRAR